MRKPANASNQPARKQNSSRFERILGAGSLLRCLLVAGPKLWSLPRIDDEAYAQRLFRRYEPSKDSNPNARQTACQGQQRSVSETRYR